MSISKDEARKIFHDRIRFKFYCAEKHLNNLRTFAETKDSEGHKEFYNKTYTIRIRWEDETECVLFHLIGALDALLFRMIRVWVRTSSVSNYSQKNYGVIRSRTQRCAISVKTRSGGY